MLKALGPEIWIAEGGEVTAIAGFRYPTRMAVIRLANGELFIWSPIALTDALRKEVDALGRVGHIVAPNALHHLFLPQWQRAYAPAAKVYAAPGLRAKRKDIAFDGDLGATTIADWAGDIDQVVAGNRISDEVVFFHRKSGTVLFCDLLQQIPPNLLSGWRAVIARLDLMTGPEPSVPRKFRMAFTNRRAARAALEHVLAWPAQKVVMAHGTPVEKEARAFLSRAFAWLIA
jgi:hypothetical protein